MADSGRKTCLIVGAGVAGLTAGRILHDSGFRVIVLEKSRQIGGRLSTREPRGTNVGPMNHGAPYFVGRLAPFNAMLAGLSKFGSLDGWNPRGKDDAAIWHASARMNSVLQPLSYPHLDHRQLDIRCEHTVSSLSPAANGMHLTVMCPNTPEPSVLQADLVILSCPAPQAAALTASLGAPFQALASVRYAPCYAGLFAFDERLPVDADFLRDTGDISFAHRAGSLPGAPNGPERWVVHGSAAWSAANLERDKPDMVPPLMQAFAAMVGVALPTPIYAAAHRWRYSQVETAVGQPYLINDAHTLAVIGDSLPAQGDYGGGVEAAFHSARLLADYLRGR